MSIVDITLRVGVYRSVAHFQAWRARDMKHRKLAVALLIASIGLVFGGLPTYLLSQAKSGLDQAMLDSIHAPSTHFYTSIESLETVSRFPGFRTVALDLILDATLRLQGRYINQCEALLDAAEDKKQDALRLERDLANKRAITVGEQRRVSNRSDALADKLRANRLAHRWRAIGVSQEQQNSFCQPWRRFTTRFANSPKICKMCIDPLHPKVPAEPAH